MNAGAWGLVEGLSITLVIGGTITLPHLC